MRININTCNAKELISYGKELYNQHKLDEALSAFHALVTRAPHKRDHGYRWIVRIYKLQGKLEEALNTSTLLFNSYTVKDSDITTRTALLRILGRQDETLYTVTGKKVPTGNPKALVLALLSRTLIPAHHIDFLLQEYELPPPLNVLCKEYLTFKAQTFERTRPFEFSIVSLGTNCYPGSFIFRWALGNFGCGQRSTRLPFDLAKHNGNSVFHLLNSNFSGYCDPENLEIAASGEIGECFKIKDRNIVFNHDAAITYQHDTGIFAETLRERVDSFNKVIAASDNIIFLFLTDPKHDCQKVVQKFNSLLPKLERRLHVLVIHRCDTDEFIQKDRVFLLKTNFQLRQDWFRLDNLISEETLAFEKLLINSLVRVIEAVCPQRMGAQVSIEKVAESLRTNLAEEIADEYNAKKYIRELQVITCLHPKTSPDAGERARRIGAIVMNCNPFTLGHRYLIELASSMVDTLVIFVVEEDLSFFPFQDRFELVRAGTVDIPNVHVVRSGKFIISTVTFPLYFTKDNPDMAKFDASQDLDFFGKYIAPALGITVRFAGAEPSCAVTNAYNNQMAQILPHYGVRFEEIPRREYNGKAISASLVREYIKTGNVQKTKNIVPKTTFTYLKHHYSQPSVFDRLQRFFQTWLSRE